MDADSLITKLDSITEKYRGNRKERFFRYPFFVAANSIVGRLFNQLFNSRIVWKTKRTTFFGEPMYISIPPYQEILFCGAYASHDPEVRLTKFLIRELEHGKHVFFDLGAHYGYYTLLAHALMKNNGGQIVAFEPSTLVLPYLRKNVADKNSVMLVEKGVSDSDGSATFYESDAQYSVISTLNPENLNEVTHLGDIKKSFTVETVTIDTFCAEHTIIPTVIKIDVEGAEEKALIGARNTLTNHAPIVAMEVFLDPMTDVYKRAVALMQTYGYNMYAITPDGRTEPIAYENLMSYIDKLKSTYAARGDDASIDNIIFKKGN